MPGVLLWGWDDTNKVWIPLQVDTNGLVKVDMSAIHTLLDADEDTGWDVEQAADEDKIHGKVKGVEAFLLSDKGILTLAKQSMAAGRQTSDQTIPSGMPHKPLFFDTEESDIQNEMDLASGSGTAEIGTAGTTLHDDGVFAGAAAGDHIWNRTDHTYWVIASVTSDDEVETTAAHDIGVGDTFTWFRAKYTVKEPGSYLVIIKVLLQAMADGKYGAAFVYVDGVGVMAAAIPCSINGSYPAPTAIAPLYLTAGQVIEGYVYQNNGTNIDTRGLTAYDTRYNIIKMA